jgi:hypothetical protein
MDEEKIFGPLSLRQFLYVAVAAGAVYAAYLFLPLWGAAAAAVAAAIVTLPLVRAVEPPPFDQKFIDAKKASLAPEDFQRWQRRKVAELQSQISARAERGLSADSELERAKAMVEAAAGESRQAPSL